MTTTAFLPLALLAAVALAAIVWFAMRSQVSALTAVGAERERRLADLERELARARAEAERVPVLEERLRIAESERETDHAREERLKAEMARVFNELQDGAVRRLAEESQRRIESQHGIAQVELERKRDAIAALLKPVNDGLAALDTRIKEIETVRASAYSGLTQKLEDLLGHERQLMAQAASLREATTTLSTSLRSSQVRGNWGEFQLRNCVELAGMVDFVDFREQETMRDDDGNAKRPDLLVRIPGSDQRVPVDAKFSGTAFFDGCAATDETLRRQHFVNHAAAIKLHADQLAKRDYTRSDETSPFVIMFIPGEAMLSAALGEDPNLIERAAAKGVYIASPLTLVALLRSYAAGWTQLRQERHAREIAEAAKELYSRVLRFGSHYKKVGERLRKATEAFNEGAGTWSRVGAQARRLESLGVSDKEAEAGDDVDMIGVVPREIDTSDRRQLTMGIVAESEL